MINHIRTRIVQLHGNGKLAYNGNQGRTQELVQRGALFKICLLSTARSVAFVLGVLPPPPEQVLPSPQEHKL